MGEKNLLINQRMDSPLAAEVASGDVSMFSTANPESDPSAKNEDSALVFEISKEKLVLAVADGCGGHRAGDQASSLALKEMAKALERGQKDNNELRTSIINGFEEANKKILQLGLGAMTTLSVIEIDGPRARPYHVGDSSIIIVSSRGRLRFQSVSHSPVGYALEAGLLNEEEAFKHEERHLVSNLVGAEDMRLEVGATIELSRQDRILIGSDGLFDNVAIDRVVELARKGSTKKAARHLVEVAKKVMLDKNNQDRHPDDLTFLIYKSRSTRAKRK